MGLTRIQDLNDQIIKAELQAFVSRLNFVDVMQFFTSKLFSKLLATGPTQEQTDTLQKWKQESKGSVQTEDVDSKFDTLDYEMFSSKEDTIKIISESHKKAFTSTSPRRACASASCRWSTCRR